MDIGKKIRQLRLQNDLTLEDLASRSELTKGFLSQLERDLTSPSISTLEDILEELVGEIWDEHDEVSPEIEQKSENECTILGNTNVDKLFETLDIEATEDDMQTITVNGWVMNHLGRIPAKHDSFEYQGYQFTVLEMDEKRIEKIHIIKL